MKPQPKNSKTRQGEQGNVLFLILIAVALFAALSYAVTQSTRSGGGDANNERSLVNSAALTQYPASLKTAIVRMTVSNGVDVSQLLFDTPSGFSALDTLAEQQAAVFYPTGGGATYNKGSADVSDNGAGFDWVFNAENSVKNIGTTSGTAPITATADIIAFLPHVSKSVCDKIHDQLGLSTTIPTITGADVTSMMNTSDLGIPTSPAGAQLAGSSDELTGQPQGCFQKVASTNYVYYHVLVER